MDLKKDEIQRQILIYLIEDENSEYTEKQEPCNNANQSVEKLDSVCCGIDGQQNISTATVSIIQAPSNYNVNVNANSRSINEESCNSVNSINLLYQSNKKSDELKIDSNKKQKETNQIISDNQVKPIKVVKLDTIKYSFQLIGFKYKDAHQFCEILNDNFKEKVAEQSKEMQNLQEAFGKFKMARAYLHSSQLYKGIVEFAQKNAPRKLVQQFDMCVQILQKKYPLIILLGGTSGTGKSTLSSILSSRFQIPTVLSTDSIRHIIRNFMDESEEPLLFTSTYEAGEHLKDDTITKESKKTIQGYKIQCKLVQQKLEDVISQYAKKGEPMIIEGVHLTPRFMFSMMKKYPYVMPFTICIEKESKHRQRFAVRSKYMTLDKKINKYIQYISNIRMIQAWFMEKSDEHLIPKINNVNIDKSINIIHRVVTTYMRKMINEKMSVIPEKAINALKLYKSYNKVTKPPINKLLIDQEVNKDLIIQKFLENLDQEENEHETNSNHIKCNYTDKSSNSNSIHDDIFQNGSQLNPCDDIKIGIQNSSNKTTQSTLSLENIFVNRNTSPSIDLLSIDKAINIQDCDKLGNGILNLDQQQIQNSQQINSLSYNTPLNNTNNNIINNNSSSKDPKLLLNQFLNDLEDKYPSSFVEYTISKIEDMQQTVLKEYQQKSARKISDLSISQAQNIQNNIDIQKNQFKFFLDNLMIKNTDANINTLLNMRMDNQKLTQINSTQSDNTFQINKNGKNNEIDILNGKSVEFLQINGQNSNQLQGQKLNLINSNINDQIQSQYQNKQINNMTQNNILSDALIQTNKQNLEKMNNLNLKKITKRKKKLKMDEKSNYVTINSSSHNEEQVNTEQQSEGDSLLMGEDNYQFDVLSEGDEGEEDLDNPEEHSNSIDDEEEADYNDNFGNQSDESSEYDEEIKDDQYTYDEDDDDEEEEDQESELDKENFVYKLGDVVNELDPQQVKYLDYENYQQYIKSIKEIIEATINQQYRQKGLQLQRKKLYQSKSQLFNQEEEGKIQDKIEIQRKQKQHSGKYERQFSYFKKYESNSQQVINSVNSMTQSINLQKKRSSKLNKGMKKTLNNYNLMIQKQNLSISNQDSCSSLTENRPKSCEPDLAQKNIKNKNKIVYSHFKEEKNKQIQGQSQNQEIDNKLNYQEINNNEFKYYNQQYYLQQEKTKRQ